MFLFVKYIVEQEEWNKRFELNTKLVVLFFFFFPLTINGKRDLKLKLFTWDTLRYRILWCVVNYISRKPV